MLDKAINELKQVKSIEEWNTVRAKWVPLLTRDELGTIDGSGLVVKVLGRD
jgi:hypothetical protein